MKKYASAILICCTLFFGCEKKSDLQVNKVMPAETSATGSEPTASNETSIDESSKQIIITPQDELHIAVRADYPPLMWKENDELKGYFVDVETAILNRMGQKYKMIAHLDAGKTFHDVKAGVSDCAIGFARDPIYEDAILLSDSYYTITAPLFVKGDRTDISGNNMEELIANLSGKKVGTQTRSPEVELFRQYPDIKLIEYATGTEAMEALTNGDVDAKLEVLEIGLYSASQNGWNIRPIAPPILNVEVVMGFYRGINQDLVDRYNKALKELKDSGEIQRIYDRWFK